MKLCSCFVKYFRLATCYTKELQCTIYRKCLMPSFSTLLYRCQRHFWVADRKHHCRNCGLLFCHSCSSKTAPVPKENLLAPVRVCDDCFVVLNKAAAAAVAGGPKELRGEEEVVVAENGGSNCDISGRESDIESACEADEAELA